MWSSKLFRRVFIAFATLIVVSAVLFAVLISRGQEAELRARLIQQLRTSSMLLSELMASSPAGGESLQAEEQAEQLQARVRRLGERANMRLTLIAIDGRVLADSEKESLAAVNRMEDHRLRPEVQAALHDGFGLAQRYSSTVEEPQLYYAARVDRDGQPIGIARASLPMYTIRGEIQRGRLRVWTFAAVVSLTSILGAIYLVARITQPLTNLTGAVERMAAGHMGTGVEAANRDEIGTLARAFSALSDDLRAQLDRLKERGDHLAAVLGGMVEGVIAVDRHARVMFANGAAARLFDFRADQAQGKPLLTLIRDETLHQSIQKAMTTGDVVTAEMVRHVPSDGALALHATPLPGSPCPGVVLVLYDQTRLRRLESLRQEFVANVSHELKTPLSSIKAYAETLRSGAINDQQHNMEFVKRIEDQADRLHQLIMDLLSLTRIESGKGAYELEDVDVQEAVESCLLAYGPAAAAKQIELAAEPPADRVVIRADDEAVRQILDNLVDNAIKYVPTGGHVKVRWQRQQRDARIEVIDTGIGIEASHLDRLFERFYRVDKARSRELGGTGLGLSIVKHLAQFFGGTVGVESEVGEGSTFWVRLPLARP